MRLVTYRKGAGRARVGVVVGDAVLDLGEVAADLARERGTVRRGRGGFPKAMLELIQGGPAALAAAREAVEHGHHLLDDLPDRRVHCRTLGRVHAAAG
jgi:hypothetical protein